MSFEGPGQLVDVGSVLLLLQQGLVLQAAFSLNLRSAQRTAKHNATNDKHDEIEKSQERMVSAITKTPDGHTQGRMNIEESDR